MLKGKRGAILSQTCEGPGECALSELLSGAHTDVISADKLNVDGVFDARIKLAGVSAANPEATTIKYGGADEETLQIVELVQSCIDRIKAGDCSKYILNTGQYQSSLGAILAYEEAVTETAITITPEKEE